MGQHDDIRMMMGIGGEDFVWKLKVAETFVTPELVLTYSPEGFGRMTAEAAFSGCLVIGYNSAGTKEILEETGGLLWDTDDEYLKAMEDVAEMTEEEYESRAICAQKRAQELFSQESYISKVLSLYSKISN